MSFWTLSRMFLLQKTIIRLLLNCSLFASYMYTWHMTLSYVIGKKVKGVLIY